MKSVCTIRDKEILSEVMRLGGMSRVEIEEKYFPHSRSYMYRRMQIMKQRGWICTRRGGIRGHKGVVYEVSEMGKELLLRSGHVVQNDAGKQMPIKKRKRAREWTERDIAILEELFKVRTLTRRQLESRFFKGNEKYGRKRIGVMKQEELIASKVVWSTERGHLEATYRITEKGMRQLVQKGRIETGYRARDLELTERQQRYVMDANELYIRCEKISFMDSRMVKRKYSLNRGDLVVGAFTTGEQDYFIYMINSGVKEMTLVKIMKEISKAEGAGYLIYCKDESARQSFESHFEKMNVVTGGAPVHILPYDEKGIWITKEMIFGDRLDELLNSQQVKPITESRYGFRFGTKLADGRKCYVLETLSGNRVLLDRVLREYRGQTTRGEYIDVLLFCWEENAKQIRERVRPHAYMHVRPLSFENLFEAHEADDEPEGSANFRGEGEAAGRTGNI